MMQLLYYYRVYKDILSFNYLLIIFSTLTPSAVATLTRYVPLARLLTFNVVSPSSTATNAPAKEYISIDFTPFPSTET